VTTTVYLCEGKDCSRAKGQAELAAAVVAEPSLVGRPVRCQKVCKGPVAGLEVNGRVEWFGRLRKGQARRALVALARDGGPIPDRLADRRSRKRSGLRRT